MDPGIPSGTPTSDTGVLPQTGPVVGLPIRTNLSQFRQTRRCAQIRIALVIPSNTIGELLHVTIPPSIVPATLGGKVDSPSFPRVPRCFTNGPLHQHFHEVGLVVSGAAVV
jgi:hypothetical protein